MLVTTELEVSQGGSGEMVLTKVGESRAGVPVDPCSGDSGGPLLKWSQVQEDFVLHATLYGGGYDCVDNRTDGDGKWNSVFPHLPWIDSFTKGEGSSHRTLEQSLTKRLQVCLLLLSSPDSGRPSLIQVVPPLS